MKKIEQFCHLILQFPTGKTKALANLIMSLASNDWGSSVVELSENRVYHYQYSSISDAINAFFEEKAHSTQAEATLARQELNRQLLSLLSSYLPKVEDYWLLNTDCSGYPCRYSECLLDRHYIHHSAHKIGNNHPITIGLDFSTIGLSVDKQASSHWNLPLSSELIPFEENKNLFTANQVNRLINEQDFFQTI